MRAKVEQVFLMNDVWHAVVLLRVDEQRPPPLLGGEDVELVAAGSATPTCPVRGDHMLRSTQEACPACTPRAAAGSATATEVPDDDDWSSVPLDDDRWLVAPFVAMQRRAERAEVALRAAAAGSATPTEDT
jgi:hypothetical protein